MTDKLQDWNPQTRLQPDTATAYTVKLATQHGLCDLQYLLGFHAGAYQGPQRAKPGLGAALKLPQDALRLRDNIPVAQNALSTRS